MGTICTIKQRVANLVKTRRGREHTRVISSSLHVGPRLYSFEGRKAAAFLINTLTLTAAAALGKARVGAFIFVSARYVRPLQNIYTPRGKSRVMGTI